MKAFFSSLFPIPQFAKRLPLGEWYREQEEKRFQKSVLFYAVCVGVSLLLLLTIGIFWKQIGIDPFLFYLLCGILVYCRGYFVWYPPKHQMRWSIESLFPVMNRNTYTYLLNWDIMVDLLQTGMTGSDFIKLAIDVHMKKRRKLLLGFILAIISFFGLAIFSFFINNALSVFVILVLIFFALFIISLILPFWVFPFLELSQIVRRKRQSIELQFLWNNSYHEIFTKIRYLFGLLVFSFFGIFTIYTTVFICIGLLSVVNPDWIFALIFYAILFAYNYSYYLNFRKIWREQAKALLKEIRLYGKSFQLYYQYRILGDERFYENNGKHFIFITHDHDMTFDAYLCEVFEKLNRDLKNKQRLEGVEPLEL